MLNELKFRSLILMGIVNHYIESQPYLARNENFRIFIILDCMQDVLYTFPGIATISTVLSIMGVLSAHC